MFGMCFAALHGPAAGSTCSSCWPFCSCAAVSAICFVAIMQHCWEAIAGDHDIDMEKLQLQKKAWGNSACEVPAAVCAVPFVLKELQLCH